ncbi:cysteine proteinase [Lophium mytilinum]|uniref:ubiquitinyl hydrolase 1 n=1 Tax=Lophium mytilinum TaxID=390894 RepID=A0A6A6QBN6_9PEZI|nr:cysteine proteinase [Lophium mytilinum]
MPSDEELAHLQKLSNEYEPEVTGPLVGERQSSSAITTEYANADPVYRTKTAALPSKYSHYRTCRGDGHCGWRAIAFTYFEALLRVGDKNRFLEEETRLRSLRNLLNTIGFQEHLYEDFADECFDLLRRTGAAIPAVDDSAAAELLASFNDVGISMAIITYFKLLTSAWIQTHPDDFQPFLEFGQDIKQYCSTQIEPSICEIDHIGMSALAEVLVKPAGFAMEVLYLDRSPGDQVTEYNFDPLGHDGLPLHNPPTMRLLYRPGHYDILYKIEDVQSPIVSQAPLHVNLAGYTDEFVPMSRGMSDVMTLIPGLYPTGMGQNWPPVSYDFHPTPVPQPQMAPVSSYAPVLASTPNQEYANPVHQNVPLDPPVNMPLNPLMANETARGGPFRPSVYELEPGFHSGQAPLQFQTSIFRNSHYNTAHFLNPDFQPEEWTPDSEYVTTNRSRHKSTSQ